MWNVHISLKLANDTSKINNAPGLMQLYFKDTFAVLLVLISQSTGIEIMGRHFLNLSSNITDSTNINQY